MTREEEIDKAAEKFAFSDKTETPDFHDVINDFYYGAKWADKTMIEKACGWIEKNKHQYKVLSFGSLSTDWSKFIKEFCKAMKE